MAMYRSQMLQYLSFIPLREQISHGGTPTIVVNDFSRQLRARRSLTQNQLGTTFWLRADVQSHSGESSSQGANS